MLTTFDLTPIAKRVKPSLPDKPKPKPEAVRPVSMIDLRSASGRGESESRAARIARLAGPGGGGGGGGARSSPSISASPKEAQGTDGRSAQPVTSAGFSAPVRDNDMDSKAVEKGGTRDRPVSISSNADDSDDSDDSGNDSDDKVGSDVEEDGKPGQRATPSSTTTFKSPLAQGLPPTIKEDDGEDSDDEDGSKDSESRADSEDPASDKTGKEDAESKSGPPARPPATIPTQFSSPEAKETARRESLAQADSIIRGIVAGELRSRIAQICPTTQQVAEMIVSLLFKEHDPRTLSMELETDKNAIDEKIREAKLVRYDVMSLVFRGPTNVSMVGAGDRGASGCCYGSERS